MEQLQLLGALLVVDMLAAMSPGPNFVLVTRTAIGRDLPHAAAVVSGFTAANLVWCSAVLLGLSALFELVPWLYGTIKVLGGLYLVYLGISLWRVHAFDDRTVADAPRVSLRASFGAGLLTNLTNPKSAVYFGSIFTLFLNPDAPGWVRIAAVGVVLVDTVLWYGSVAVLFSRPRAQRIYRRLRRRIDRLAGTVLVAFGARLALVRD